MSNIDKSWINKPRTSQEYLEGLEIFLDFAFERSVEGKIKCPCPRCNYKNYQIKSVVYGHLVLKPFPKNYQTWIFHGESFINTGNTSTNTPTNTFPNSPTNTSTSSTKSLETTILQDSMDYLLNDAFGFGESNEPIVEDEEFSEIEELIKDGSQALYEGCKKYTKLSFLIKLYHIKCFCRMTDKAMTMILELLSEAFEHAKIPVSFYEAKKTITKLGMNCTKIDVCPNDCMLYWEDDKHRESCKICNASRWKDNGKKKKQPVKILRYFPLKPRLQRLFMCSKTADSMIWHDSGHNNDGGMRHPRDSRAWKEFNLTHSDFALEPRNVRLGLAADGFNPYGIKSTNYSIWPVILIPYNRPPWECMKQTNFILSMIIPGKKMPGNDIDVYLQPLVKELQELWNNGVQAFDASKGETFNMKAALMWTISDLPGLGSLSGWNTYTGLACPVCNFDTAPRRLKHSKKISYIGHRRYLKRRHKFRSNKTCFDGFTEERDPPKNFSGSDILQQVRGIEVVFGKKPEPELGQKRQRRKPSQQVSNQWRKKSIFFNLSYWVTNQIRHNLDPMYIEKNVLENLLYTLLNVEKTKDDVNARQDLKEMCIRRELWPDDNGKYPPAIFTIPNEKKQIFFNTLKNIKVPDGYASNISRCFEQKTIYGLKSHDCHILMQQLLPLAIRNVWPDKITAVVVELSSFFRQLCGKSLKVSELDKLNERMILTLCHMEMLFPPSFFTVMIHLTAHLVDEAKLGGPVHYRWMYPIERYLGRLKSYVRNRGQPEGSIVECYLADEALNFCSQYLENIETKFNRPRRVDDRHDGIDISDGDSIFPPLGNPGGKGSTFMLTPLERLQAHRYVLLNCPHVQIYIDQFKDYVKVKNPKVSAIEIERKVVKDFVEWFPKLVNNPDLAATVSPVLKYLSYGPLVQAKRYTSYKINGLKFRITSREIGMKTQNSGVCVTSKTSCVSSSVDKRSSSRYWTVNVLNPSGGFNRADLTLQKLIDLEEGFRVVVDFEGLSPFGLAAGLLGAVCGLMATDYGYFPISFKNWHVVPDSYFDNAWKNMFERKFFFRTVLDIAKRFVNSSMNEKWKARRCKLWKDFYDPTTTRNDIIVNIPDGVPRDQWTTFVDYRLNIDTKKMCAQNKENSRDKIPSACGAKSLMRRKKEMEVELKKIVGRGPLYVCTHKKKNGEYTHVEAERICVEIEQEMTQNPQAFSDISTTDPVGKRHKPEHGGRVRGLGLGALPSVTLKSSRRKFRGSVYEIGETSGSSNVVLEKLDVALREVAMFRSIMKKLVPVAEYEKALREALEEEEDDSSDGSNGHFSN